MSRPNESSAIIRFIRGAHRAPVLDAEHGVATQVVANPYLRERRSRNGYVAGIILLVAGITAGALFTRRTAIEPETEATPVAAAAAEPAANSASPDPRPLVTAVPVPADVEIEDDPTLAGLKEFDGQVVLEDGDFGLEQGGLEQGAEVELADDAEIELAEEVAPPADEAPVTPRLEKRTAPPSKPVRKTQVPAKISTNKGVLMIASKPPCRIYVDGKDTGLTTPQLDIRLKQGRHKILLVNREFELKHSIKVSIRAGAKVRIVRDLTASMK